MKWVNETIFKMHTLIHVPLSANESLAKNATFDGTSPLGHGKSNPGLVCSSWLPELLMLLLLLKIIIIKCIKNKGNKSSLFYLFYCL